ncbi:MAG TPA: alpha/beta hydrolase [Pyrinomonadaceae bacterium]|nr:alpha/beta hydrolase [Pyrinomonadaceae bacterium]
MKKRYLIAGAYALAGAGVAAKLLRRPRDLDWERHGGHLREAGRSRFADIDGVRLHYVEAGEAGAPVIMLIHGFCASTLVWNDVIVPLAEAGFRVVAPDLVGFGFSEKPRRWEYTIEAQARTVVRLMDELGVESAAVVGSSYGGAVAAVCALDYAERVERVVLVCAVSNDDVKRQLLLRLAAAPLMGNVLSPLVLDSPRLMKWRMGKVYGERSAHLTVDERMGPQHLPLRAARTQRAVLQTLRRWDAARIEREAHRVEHPVLLVWGDRDRDVPLHNGERLHALMPHSRLVVFRDCGHMPQEERPEEFAGLVAGFCQKRSMVNSEP